MNSKKMYLKCDKAIAKSCSWSPKNVHIEKYRCSNKIYDIEMINAVLQYYLDLSSEVEWVNYTCYDLQKTSSMIPRKS